MKSQRYVLACGAVTAAVALASCAGSDTVSTDDLPKEPPYKATLETAGDFALAPSIAGAVQSKDPLELVFSFQTLSEVGAPALLKAGLESGAAKMEEKYGVEINTRIIGPPSPDSTTQVSQVVQAIGAKQVDCLGIGPPDPGSFLNTIDKAVDDGIPTWTVGSDSPESRRFAYIGPNDVDLEGENNLGILAGEQTVAWAKENGETIEKAALGSGDPSGPWAQGRMKGWLQVVQKEFPDMEVVGSPTNALNTTFDAAEIYSTVGSFLGGNPDVDFFFHTDWGGAAIGKLLEDKNLEDQVTVLAYNLDDSYIQQIRAGNLMATLDQAYQDQSEEFVNECADFLLGGVIPSEEFVYTPPIVVTQENVDEVEKEFHELGGS